MKKILIDGLGFINPNRMSTGNKKIVATLIFNMPAGKVGTCNQTCKGCYALKAERLYPNVKSQRYQNKFLFDNHQDTLRTLLLTQLESSPLTVIRIHESGDFFSVQYFNWWCEIVRLFPDKKFYAYTKSLGDNVLLPDNFNVLNSWIHNGVMNYGTIDQCRKWEKQGYYVCPATLTKEVQCNKHCFYCHSFKKVSFVKH